MSMRINVFVAQSSGLSRRGADRAIAERRVRVNGRIADVGQAIEPDDAVTLDGQVLRPPAKLTVMLNKPAGYVCSRRGQGSRTVYDLLPAKYHHLKPVGRLDKDSSGLLLLTDDGDLANRLTHPRYEKLKIYEVALDKPLAAADKELAEQGVELEDGVSKVQIKNLDGNRLTVSLSEGRNRQIRRTFAALGYTVRALNRVRLGDYALGSLPTGHVVELV